MSCKSFSLNGIQAHCDSAPGGLREVYIAEASDVSLLTYDDPSTRNVIETITMDTDKKFKKYTFRPGNSNFNSEFQSDVTTGAAAWTSTLELVFTRADASKRLDILALVTDDCVVIVQDKAGNYIYMGNENPVNSTAGTHETGTATTDRNAYSVTLVTDGEFPPSFVDPDIIAGIVGQ